MLRGCGVGNKTMQMSLFVGWRRQGKQGSLETARLFQNHTHLPKNGRRGHVCTRDVPKRCAAGHLQSGDKSTALIGCHRVRVSFG
jgi:hypothetical protein